MSKIAILMEDDKYVGTMNMTTGQTTGTDNSPAGPVPAPVTDIIAALFMHAKGEDIPVTHGWWDQPQGAPSVRQAISLANGQHVTLDPQGKNTGWLLTPAYPCVCALHIPGSGGIVDVKWAPNNLHGSAASSVGAEDAPATGPSLNNDNLTSFRFRDVVPVGQFANLYLTLDSGDPTFLVTVNPNG